MKWTLLMRFAGPMQSWGTRSRFGYRDTEVAPSKSGVVGLLAAALGRKRAESVTDLASLRLGVREDQPGIIQSDYHTALHAVRADGSANKASVLSQRVYLADAKFLVGVESSDRAHLEELYQALQNPHWPLSLGRRAFAPSEPVALRPPNDADPLVSNALEDALVQYPALIEPEADATVRYFIEDPAGEYTWFDQPTDNFQDRTFTTRTVRVVAAKWGEQWY